MLFKLICAGTASYVTGPNMGKAFGPGLPHNDSTPSPLKKLPCAKTTSCALEFNPSTRAFEKNGVSTAATYARVCERPSSPFEDKSAIQMINGMCLNPKCNRVDISVTTLRTTMFDSDPSSVKTNTMTATHFVGKNVTIENDGTLIPGNGSKLHYLPSYVWKGVWFNTCHQWNNEGFLFC